MIKEDKTDIIIDQKVFEYLNIFTYECYGVQNKIKEFIKDSLASNNKTIRISKKYFYNELFYYIKERTNILINHINDYDYKEFDSEFKGIADKYKFILEKLDKETTDLNTKYLMIEQLIIYASRLIEINYYYSFRADLKRSFRTINREMKYLNEPDKQLAIKYKNEIEKCISSNNINDLSTACTYFDKINELVKNEYQNSITKTENLKQVSDFNLICHATKTTNFSSEFKSKYVSASLITPEFLKTFNDYDFGFILDPSNIVNADSMDTYTNNKGETLEEVLGTKINIIKPINMIKDEMNTRKKEYEEMKIKSEVSNEIVIDGFNPVGIFCITDGSKALSDAYHNALKLQESFPNLKVYDIDRSLYQNEDKIEARNNLIRVLWYREKKEYPTTKKCEFFNDIYDYFTESKKNNTYNEEELLEKFRRRLNLYYNDSISAVINGNYTAQEIEIYITKFIDFNRKLNFTYLSKFKRNFKNFYNNPSLKEKCPKINELIGVLNNTEITVELVQALNKTIPTTPDIMIDIISKYKLTNLEQEKNLLIERKTKVEEDLDLYRDKVKKYQESKALLDNVYQYKLGRNTLDSVKKEIDEKGNAINETSFQIVEETNKKNSYKKELENLKSKVFSKIYKKEIDNIEIKIKEIEQRIKSYESSRNLLCFEQKLKSKQLTKLEAEFKGTFKYDYQKYEKMLNDAKKFYNDDDYENALNTVNTLETELNLINEKLVENGINIEKQQEEEQNRMKRGYSNITIIMSLALLVMLVFLSFYITR